MSDLCFSCPHPDCRDDCPVHADDTRSKSKRYTDSLDPIARIAASLARGRSVRIERIARQIERAA